MKEKSKLTKGLPLNDPDKLLEILSAIDKGGEHGRLNYQHYTQALSGEIRVKERYPDNVSDDRAALFAAMLQTIQEKFGDTYGKEEEYRAQKVREELAKFRP